MKTQFINAIKSRCEDVYYFRFYLKNGFIIQGSSEYIEFFDDYLIFNIENAGQYDKPIAQEATKVPSHFTAREYYIPYEEINLFAVAAS